MARAKKRMNKNSVIISVALIIVLAIIGSFGAGDVATDATQGTSELVTVTEGYSAEVTVPESEAADAPSTEEVKDSGVNNLKAELPEFKGEAYVAINGNEPQFTAGEITDKYFEIYEPLDRYG
ncbi:MAG: hypothetical protein IKV44_02720, partial [Clostridia bacterium]|nr:hypothetical protein [Clostridia bacterium]